jgi:predicted N-acetyltransferase YhbS
MSITIRKMIPEDMQDALSILSQWNIAPITPSPENPDPERSSINIDHSFVAVDQGAVVGICSYIIHSKERAETASLAVDTDYKNKGIGYKLQKARLDEMKKRGIKRVRTETDRPENVEWFTKKFHYRIIGKNKKKHSFGLPDMDYWNVLELDLEKYEA